jgi:Zn-dependent protease
MVKVSMQLDWMGIMGIIIIVTCIFAVIIVWVWHVSEEEKEQHRIVTSGRFALFALKWYYILLLIAGFILLGITLYEILTAAEITLSLGVLSAFALIGGLLLIGAVTAQVVAIVRIRHIRSEKKKAKSGNLPPY